jgi:hypothetical protein
MRGFSPCEDELFTSDARYEEIEEMDAKLLSLARERRHGHGLFSEIAVSLHCDFRRLLFAPYAFD